MEAFIKAISFYIPSTKLTNEDLSVQFPEWSAEKVASKLGIKERGIVQQSETVSDMAVQAAQKLFEEHKIDSSKIDFLLLCTQSPDYLLPTTACLVQNRLNLPLTVGALDFNLGCSGFVYGLSLAKGLVMSGAAKNILLITSETYSKYIHPLDKSNKAIFGDGAAATLISDEGIASIQEFVFGTDGNGADNLIVRNNGVKNKKIEPDTDYVDVNGNIANNDNLYMNGPEIFNFTLKAVPGLIKDTLQKNGLSFESVDHFVLHQANRFILDSLRKKMRIPEEKFHFALEKYGNTVSSTLPIALKDAIDKGKITPAQNILLAGFGVGYSWAACVLKSNPAL